MGISTGEPTALKVRKSTERPCYKLSADLLKTYKGINELFYEQKRKKQLLAEAKASQQGVDDEHGNYIVRVGEEIGGRYLVQESLGKGSFGVVLKALDQKRDECVAVKVIKNKAQFFQQAKVEIDILTKLNSSCNEDHNIVKLRKVFTWKEHLCLVFELLSFNLYDLLKYTKFNGISLNLVRKFAYQILKTLEYLSSSAVGVIHCDLKPENILLKNPKRSGIKVIDFGSSCYVSKKMFKYIQSRFYRSPEVILGLPYDCAIDIWSLGCVLVEMHTGQPVFDGKDESEQLIKMACILGPQPQRMVEQSTKRKDFYQWDHKQKQWVLDPPKHNPSQYPHKTLGDILGVSIGGPGGRRKGQQGHSEADYLQFVDFVQQMFNYTPSLRITPSLALQHPFLAPVVNELISPNGFPSPSISRVPTSPASSTIRDSKDVGLVRQLSDIEQRTPLTSYTASYSSQELKWRCPATTRELATNTASSDIGKQTVQERRISLPSSMQATQTYRMVTDLDSDHPPQTDVIPPASSVPLRTQSGSQLSQLPISSSLLTRTRTVPHVSSARKSLGSPSQASLETCLHDTLAHSRPREYQAAAGLGSPMSPSASFAQGSLRLKPKQPGGTAQLDHVSFLQSPQAATSASGTRSMAYLSSPAARAVLYADSPNSGKYGPGTPLTPRTAGGAELRQYIAGSLGSPLPPADGRKWLPSPMLTDVTRKLCPDSPSGGDILRTDSTEKLEIRSTGLGSWKAPAYMEVSYGAARPVATLHHGGAEPMARPMERDTASDYL